MSCLWKNMYTSLTKTVFETGNSPKLEYELRAEVSKITNKHNKKTLFHKLDVSYAPTCIF